MFISSPRRATAGVRISIGRDVGPLFGLNAVSAIGGQGDTRRSEGRAQGLSSGGDDAVPKGDNPGQRVLALPAALGPLDRGAAAGPGLIQALEGERRSARRCSRAGRVSEAAGMRADDSPNSAKRYP